MLEELKKYDNLGTPGYFWELFHQLKKEDFWTEKNISSYFFNKIVDDRNIFDGCIPLLRLSKIISINEETKEVEIDFSYKNILYSEQLCKQKLLEGFLLAFHKDDKFYDIFSSKNISYDIIYKTIQIDYSAFGLRYANIRKLLIDFGFLAPHLDFPQKKLIIQSIWKKFFDKTFTPEIRKRKIGIEELREKLEQQQINGEKAEQFIMDFEQKRLKNKENIQWIAPYDSAVGYDILSFNNIQSQYNDRFIEVKSFIKTPYFYWTKNEIKIAEEKGKNYFLYLVDRDKVNNNRYKPIIISNPTKKVLSNKKWVKEIDKYYIFRDK